MKAHRIYPIPLREGYERQALLELSWEELDGLWALIGEVLCEASQDRGIILNFETSICTGAPFISCEYEKED